MKWLFSCVWISKVLLMLLLGLRTGQVQRHSHQRHLSFSLTSHHQPLPYLSDSYGGKEVLSSSSLHTINRVENPTLAAQLPQRAKPLIPFSPISTLPQEPSNLWVIQVKLGQNFIEPPISIWSPDARGTEPPHLLAQRTRYFAHAFEYLRQRLGRVAFGII